MHNANYWQDLEVLVIETPENLELRLPLAGFGPRFLAILIDALIVGVATALLVTLAIFGSISLVAAFGEEIAMWLIIGFLAIIILVPLGYFIVFEQIWNGQTPGKRVAGIRVIKRGGLPLTLGDVLLRNVLRLVDHLPANGFTGMVSFFATKYQQRLGDLVADTVVIREFKSTVPLSWAGDDMGATGQHALGTMTPALNYAITTYLWRTAQLDQVTRFSLSGSLIQALGYDSTSMGLQEREGYLASIITPQGTHV